MNRIQTIIKFFLTSLVLVLLPYLLQSCKHEPPSISDLKAVYYETDIAPLLSVCSKCHTGSRGENFDAASYTGVLRSVKKGDPWGSKLYTIVSSPNNPNMMPPKGYAPLSEIQRTLIEVWILQGAKSAQDTVK